MPASTVDGEANALPLGATTPPQPSRSSPSRSSQILKQLLTSSTKKREKKKTSNGNGSIGGVEGDARGIEHRPSSAAATGPSTPTPGPSRRPLPPSIVSAFALVSIPRKSNGRRRLQQESSLQQERLAPVLEERAFEPVPASTTTTTTAATTSTAASAATTNPSCSSSSPLLLSLVVLLASLSQAIFITLLGSFFALYTALALSASCAAEVASRVARFLVGGGGEVLTPVVAVFAHDDDSGGGGGETSSLPTATSGTATPLFLPLRSRTSSFGGRASSSAQRQKQQKQQRQQQLLGSSPAASLVLLRRDDSRRGDGSPACRLRVCCPNCGGAMSWDEEDEMEEEEEAGGAAAAPLALCSCAPVAAVVGEKNAPETNDADKGIDANRRLSFLTVSPSTSIELDDAGPSAVGLSPFCEVR